MKSKQYMSNELHIEQTHLHTTGHITLHNAGWNYDVPIAFWCWVEVGRAAN